MNKRTWPKAKYVMRRDGSLLTLGDLPSAKTIRWVISRKTIVVDAVCGGLISVEDACWRYSLTLEEFSAWKAVVERRRPEASSAQRREDLAKSMSMMSPDTALKKHLANRRSLAEARAARLASPRNHGPTPQNIICDLGKPRKEIAPHPADQMIVTEDTAWRTKRRWRR